MKRATRLVHAGLAWLLVAVILVQVFLAGRAIINLGGTGDFSSHIEFGYTWVGLAAFVMLISAVVARPGRTQVALALAVFLLYILQTFLPGLKTVSPVFGALHPVNALLLFGLAFTVARRAMTLARAEPEMRTDPNVTR
jgi:hypothetical protein